MAKKNKQQIDVVQESLLLAYADLIGFAAAMFPGYQVGSHHCKIVDALERVEKGECKRLIITMPPRHGKSMLASEFFPAWYLGRNPDKYVIAASYAQELSDDFGRKVRNTMQDPLYQKIFPYTQVRTDSSSAKRFHTSKNGVYYGVGIGGPVTGRGAHLLLIDDPVKNREEAESEVIRKKHKDWFTSTAYTRLMPGGSIVVIQTRWHEDDLAGWLLREKTEEDWEVLNLPAINESGNALWPESYPIDQLEKIRTTLGPRDWSALYMQRPTPEEGNFFKREWFNYYDKLPDKENLVFYGASDYAVTADGGDYTVHGVAAVDWRDNLYIVDIWRKQATTDEWINALVRLMRQYEPRKWAEESGQIIKSLDPFIKKRLQEERYYSTWRKQYASTSDKATRAQAFRGRLEQGKVLFPRNAPWLAEMESEMLVFPAGKNDDQVDVCSLFGRILAEMNQGDKPEPPKNTKALQGFTFNDIMAQHKRALRQKERM